MLNIPYSTAKARSGEAWLGFEVFRPVNVPASILHWQRGFRMVLLIRSVAWRYFTTTFRRRLAGLSSPRLTCDILRYQCCWRSGRHFELKE